MLQVFIDPMVNAITFRGAECWHNQYAAIPNADQSWQDNAAYPRVSIAETDAGDFSYLVRFVPSGFGRERGLYSQPGVPTDSYRDAYRCVSLFGQRRSQSATRKTDGTGK